MLECVQQCRLLVTGEPVTMVALGGSITAGQGVVERQDGYISRLYRWVQVCLHLSSHGLLNHLWSCNWQTLHQPSAALVYT